MQWVCKQSLCYLLYAWPAWATGGLFRHTSLQLLLFGLCWSTPDPVPPFKRTLLALGVNPGCSVLPRYHSQAGRKKDAARTTKHSYWALLGPTEKDLLWIALFELWTCDGHHLGRIQNVPHLYSHNRTSVFTSSMLASRRARRRSSHGAEAEKWLDEQPIGSTMGSWPPSLRVWTAVSTQDNYLCQQEHILPITQTTFSPHSNPSEFKPQLYVFLYPKPAKDWIILSIQKWDTVKDDPHLPQRKGIKILCLGRTNKKVCLQTLQIHIANIPRDYEFHYSIHCLNVGLLQ